VHVITHYGLSTFTFETEALRGNELRGRDPRAARACVLPMLRGQPDRPAAGRPMERAMVTSDLAIETSQRSSESRISVTGRLAIESSSRLRALLMKAIRKGTTAVLVIDLSGLSYLDTSGVATLLEAADVACAQGVRLRVLGLSGEPKMLAQITEIDRIFRAYGSVVELT
jgi:anti-sigma B factor antagonist